MEALEGAPVAAGGGEVDVGEVIAAEGDAKGFPDLQPLLGGEGAVGGVADDAGAAPAGDPEVVVGVEREAHGGAGGVAVFVEDAVEGAPFAEGTGFGIVVVAPGEEVGGVGVVEVEAGARFVEGHGSRDSEAVGDGFEAPVGVEAEEPAGVVAVGEDAAEDAAAGIGGRRGELREAEVGDGGDDRFGDGAVAVDDDVGLVSEEEEGAVGLEGHGADGAVGEAERVGAVGGVEAVEVVAGRIAPIEAFLAGMPERHRAGAGGKADRPVNRVHCRRFRQGGFALKEDFIIADLGNGHLFCDFSGGLTRKLHPPLSRESAFAVSNHSSRRSVRAQHSVKAANPDDNPSNPVRVRHYAPNAG